MKLARIANPSGRINILVESGGSLTQFDAGFSERLLEQIRHCNSGTAVRDLLLDRLKDGSKADLSDEYSFLTPIPIEEAWACGVTFARQAKEHEDDLVKETAPGMGLYDYVYASERPEIFFKGFGRTFVGPGESVKIRSDSSLTMPEAELVVIVGAQGQPIGFAIGNDLTAWDIEKECPLFLGQAKIWDGSGALGPWMMIDDGTFDPYGVELTCRVTRGSEIVLDSTGSTGGLRRSVPELVHYMNRHNSVPAFSVLFTGTVCVTPHDFSMETNDVVEVISAELGTLKNVVFQFPTPEGSIPGPRIDI